MADEKQMMERFRKLAGENERLRVGIMTIRDLARAHNLEHIKMRDGTTLHEYCRQLIIGPEFQEIEKVPDTAQT